MSRTLQFKRYANTVVANTTGAAGEIIIETTNNIVTVHTGSIAGGVRMASESLVVNSANFIFTHTNAAFNIANVASANITFIYGVNASQNASINAAFDKANSANVLSQSAYNQGNIAFNHANAAFNAANTAAQTVPQNAQTTNYILTSSDAGKHLYYTQAANVNLYIPWTSNASFSNGTTIMIVSRTTSSANVIVTPNVGVSMYLAGNTTSASRNVTTYGMATLIQVAANTWFINGTGVA
jgi:hypothetical protein